MQMPADANTSPSGTKMTSDTWGMSKDTDFGFAVLNVPDANPSIIIP